MFMDLMHWSGTALALGFGTLLERRHGTVSRALGPLSCMTSWTLEDFVEASRGSSQSATHRRGRHVWSFCRAGAHGLRFNVQSFSCLQSACAEHGQWTMAVAIMKAGVAVLATAARAVMKLNKDSGNGGIEVNLPSLCLEVAQ